MKFLPKDRKVTPIETPKHFFSNKRKNAVLVLAILFTLTMVAGRLIDFQFLGIFTGAGKAITRFTELYLPPEVKDFSKLVDGIWVTFLLSVAAGTIGSVLAYLAALTMSVKTGKNPVIANLMRTIVTFIRNIPVAIFAILLLTAFWFGEFLALIVMILGTFGFNARLFADMIDETNAHSIEALEAVGANGWQIITQSVIPETLPAIISWTLYAIETNIRDSTVIGMLAGGGAGHLIGIFKEFRRFQELTVIVAMIVILIVSFDLLSGYIRKRLMA